jgi:hypothetical protein
MKLIQINELRTLINMQLPHICMHREDLNQFLGIPWESKGFYPMNRYRRTFYDKQGFFHNGKTCVWAVIDSVFTKDDYRISRNYIRIADKELPLLPGGANWSPNFSFEEEGSAGRILRMLKLKAFW